MDYFEVQTHQKSLQFPLQRRVARDSVVEEVLVEEQGAERGAPLQEGPAARRRGRARVRKGAQENGSKSQNLTCFLPGGAKKSERRFKIEKGTFRLFKLAIHFWALVTTHNLPFIHYTLPTELFTACVECALVTFLCQGRRDPASRRVCPLQEAVRRALRREALRPPAEGHLLRHGVALLQQKAGTHEGSNCCLKT